MSTDHAFDDLPTNSRQRRRLEAEAHNRARQERLRYPERGYLPSSREFDEISAYAEDRARFPVQTCLTPAEHERASAPMAPRPRLGRTALFALTGAALALGVGR